MVQFVLLCILACILHLLTILLTGIACGVRVQQVNFGYGPKLLVTRRFELRAFPFGVVQSRSKIVVLIPPWTTIFPTQLINNQYGNSFSFQVQGCIMLALVAIAVGGARGVEEFFSAFHLFWSKFSIFQRFYRCLGFSTRHRYQINLW